jgi:hypothetical protein
MQKLKSRRVEINPSRFLRRSGSVSVLVLVAVWFAACGFIPNAPSDVPAATPPTPGGINFVDQSSTRGCPSEACSAILAEVAAGATTDSIPPDMTPSLQDMAKDMTKPEGTKCPRLPIADSPIWDPCIYSHGLPETAPMMVLIGDSQAWFWSRPFDTIAQNLGYRYGLAMHAACKMPLLKWTPGHGYTDEQCREWINAAIDWINQQNPAVVVVASEHPHNNVYSDEQYAAGYAGVLKQLQAPGRKLFVMGNPPIIGQDPPRCLATNVSSALKCSAPPSKAVPAHEQQATLDGARQGGAEYVNVTPFLCTPKICPSIIGKYAVFSDQFHLTTTYANRLIPVVQQAINLPHA